MSNEIKFSRVVIPTGGTMSPEAEKKYIEHVESMFFPTNIPIETNA